MEITVRWVRTIRTEKSPGGPEAARRNAVPTGFPLPQVPWDGAHVVWARERKG